MTTPLRLIQVGAGMMGRAWLRTIGNNSDCELVGLVDLDADVARRAAEDAGFEAVAISDSLPALLSRSKRMR